MGVAKTPTKKGTTVTNKYQKTMPKTSTGPGLAVPDAVTIAMGEIAEDMREGLLALAVGAGLQVMASLMEADVAAVCGPRGRHDPAPEHSLLTIPARGRPHMGHAETRALGREPGAIRRSSIRSLSFSLIRCRPAGFGDRRGRAR